MLNNILELIPDDITSFINDNWLLLSLGGASAITAAGLFIRKLVRSSKNVLQLGVDTAMNVTASLMDKKKKIEDIESKIEGLKEDLKMYIAAKNVDKTIETKRQITYLKGKLKEVK